MPIVEGHAPTGTTNAVEDEPDAPFSERFKEVAYRPQAFLTVVQYNTVQHGTLRARISPFPLVFIFVYSSSYCWSSPIFLN